jgi:hypothetical protein
METFTVYWNLRAARTCCSDVLGTISFSFLLFSLLSGGGGGGVFPKSPKPPLAPHMYPRQNGMSTPPNQHHAKV